MVSLKDYFACLKLRKLIAKGDKKRDEGKTISPDIEVIEGEHYAHKKDKDHLLEMYRPKNAKGKLPIIVSVHGGGYYYGWIWVYRYYCAYLAEQGFHVVNYNYPLAPKAKYPEPVRNVNEVMEYLLENQERLSIDLDNVFIVGDSAGAQIASQYGIVYSNPEYASLLEIRPAKFSLRALGLNCGLYDFSRDCAPIGKDRLMERLYFQGQEDALGEKKETVKYITKDYPPSFLLSFQKDFLLFALEPMVKELKKKKVKCSYKVYGDDTTFHVHHVDIDKPWAIKANADELAFFRKHMKK